MLPGRLLAISRYLSVLEIECEQVIVRSAALDPLETLIGRQGARRGIHRKLQAHAPEEMLVVRDVLAPQDVIGAGGGREVPRAGGGEVLLPDFGGGDDRQRHAIGGGDVQMIAGALHVAAGDGGFHLGAETHPGVVLSPGVFRQGLAGQNQPARRGFTGRVGRAG